ncbi:hypothetical protein N0V94_005834 [Neodidymelliopsis sp. IMI 364377]|nr:hypothetical protein N0V94_005834 [Neodidymelliopsis sp. IMI 364377]
MSTPAQEDSPDLVAKNGYQGLGFPLWEEEDYEIACFPLGAHANGAGSTSKPLPVREVAMLSVMETLTDKLDWNKKVFDEEIVAQWCKEALAIPDRYFWDLSCVDKLRSKAKYYERTGVIPTLDAYATVAKSDSLVPDNLHNALLNAFQTLQADQSKSLDWHPGSKSMVQDLVHPRKGDVIPGEEEWEGTDFGKDTFLAKYATIPSDYWSVNYQWLPSKVFLQDGTVRFTNYINNLHPTKYPGIYRTIERLIETSLPMWDQCLTLASNLDQLDGPGRTESRFAQLADRSDENPDNWSPSDPMECLHAEVDDEKL